MSDGGGWNHWGPRGVKTGVSFGANRRTIEFYTFRPRGIDLVQEMDMAEQKHTQVVTDADFPNVVEQGVGLVVVDFWAEWCGPCRAIAPTLEQLALEYQGRATIAKLDVDANPRSPMKFNVRSIPTLLFFRDGKHVDTVVGALPKPALDAKIQQHLAA